MNRVLVDPAKLTAIADVVRQFSSHKSPMTLDEIPGEIQEFVDNLIGGGGIIYTQVGTSGELQKLKTNGNVPRYVFKGMTELQEADLSNSPEVGTMAFAGLTKIGKVILSDEMSEVVSEVFEGCSGLATVEGGAAIESIAYQAFNGCSALAYMTPPPNLKTIGEESFYNTKKLAWSKLPDSVITIGPSAFRGGCLKLTELPPELTVLEGSVFRDCPLEITAIPPKVTTIGSFACSGLASAELTFPASVTSIGSRSFGWASNLQKVYFEGTPNSIAGDTFIYDTSISDIYVPWTEGAVANAPWGADNATVHYEWNGEK